MDPTFVLKALSDGADGVMIAGCHPGECHYLEQNYKALRRHRLLQKTLAQFGIEPARVRLTWASAAEGALFAQEIAVMVDEVKQLGPLNWPARPVPVGSVPAEMFPNGHEAGECPPAPLNAAGDRNEPPFGKGGGGISIPTADKDSP